MASSEIVTQPPDCRVSHTGPAIYRLKIERFRGIQSLLWHPQLGLNVILGGGDTGKSTILDAIGLLLSPTNPPTIPNTDYYGRDVANGFLIEAVMAMPPTSGIDFQFSPSWPWEWDGSDAVVPSAEGDAAADAQAVYRVRVRATEDLELFHEIVQPDGTPVIFSVTLRRALGLVRLAGDDRNDRDLRLVQGSALDRLLSDKSLRSRMASNIGKDDVAEHLLPDRQSVLSALDASFARERLPSGLSLSVTGGQGMSITSMIGLTASRHGVQLPLSSWGAGTRRLSGIAIAEQNQDYVPVTIVDEVERGLEPYRQRLLIQRLQGRQQQAFVTTHSPFVISSASGAAFWYIDHKAAIGPLDGRKIAFARTKDPAVFLSRLSVIAEGATELGFVTSLLARALQSPLEPHGIHVCDGGGHEATLDLLEALADGGLKFAGFADNEGRHPDRWKRLSESHGALLFRWATGCIEENVIGAAPEETLEALLTDPEEEKTGMRRHSLAQRLGIGKASFDEIAAEAGDRLRTLMIEAATGSVPDAVSSPGERKAFEKHAQLWFKSEVGGRELERKMFTLGLWPSLKNALLPFCNAVRGALELPASTEPS